MPSPAGHWIVGLWFAEFLCRAYPWLIASRVRLWAAILVLFELPDADFVPGVLIGKPWWIHRGPTHSILFVIVMTGISWLAARRYAPRHARLVAAVTVVALASHVALDYFSFDPMDPGGVALFWPVTGEDYVAASVVFPALSKGTILSAANVQVAIREALLLTVVGAGLYAACWAVWRARTPRPGD